MYIYIYMFFVFATLFAITLLRCCSLSSASIVFSSQFKAPSPARSSPASSSRSPFHHAGNPHEGTNSQGNIIAL